MKLSQEKKRKYQIVTLFFSLLLGVGVAAFGPVRGMYEEIFSYYNTNWMVILSLVVAGFSWLSIRLAFARWKNSHWMLLAMKMVLYFCGMITIVFSILMINSLLDYHDHPDMELGVLVVPVYWFLTVSLFAIIVIIPFGFLSYWLSRLSSTESQENQLIEQKDITGTDLNEN